MTKVFMVNEYDNTWPFPVAMWIIDEDDKRTEEEIYCDYVRKKGWGLDRTNEEILDTTTDAWETRVLDDPNN